MDKKEKYRNMLDLAFELEGLLNLALSREELPEELENLIDTKIRHLTAAGFPEVHPQEMLEAPGKKTPVCDVLPGPFYALTDDEDDSAYEKPRRGERHRRKKPVFSLNDRFLFIRELFGGDAKAFNVALNFLAEADSAEEAETYLRARGINPDDRETDARFMEVVRTYYTK
ncbi:MAG: hypothetical protein J1F07_06285 [Muribaculaceae bacterium]|nr:hypothetical protein [Muribaculaceae bacterium]